MQNISQRVPFSAHSLSCAFSGFLSWFMENVKQTKMFLKKQLKDFMSDSNEIISFMVLCLLVMVAGENFLMKKIE